MNQIRIAALAAWALGLVIANTADAAAPAYKATLLHPPEYTFFTLASAASDGSQVGWGAVDAPCCETPRALLWNGTAESVVDLHPAGFHESWAYGVSGVYQVGEGRQIGSGYHALLWSGTADSVVDLHPTGFVESKATSVSGGTQVGWGYDASYHALLWSGSAESVVDLHPSGFQHSFGTGVSRTHQVGRGYGVATGDEYHALLWSGTAASVVDLNPMGFRSSEARGVSGNSQVGTGYSPSIAGRALLWNGTAESVVDLHPPGFVQTEAHGVSVAGQVGYGYKNGPCCVIHALVWNGTAASAVDLHPYLDDLGPDFNVSFAYGIADNGTIVGFADDSMHSYAVMWTPIPEANTAALLACGIIIAAPLRRRLLRIGETS